MTSLPAGTYLAHLDTEVAAFRDTLTDLTAPIAACPGWLLGDLVAHLGEIYQWATGALGSQNAPGDPSPAPLEPALLPEWFDDRAARVRARLRAADPADPCWTLAPPRTAYFWMRRMAQETTIHRWDAQHARGGAAPIASEIAVDGIHEIAEMFLPRQIRLGRLKPLEWTITLSPAGAVPPVRLPADSDATPAADVSGPAEALLLLLWKRTTLDDDRLTVTGDPHAATAVLPAALTP